jgi:hypothetical protein
MIRFASGTHDILAQITRDTHACHVSSTALPALHHRTTATTAKSKHVTTAPPHH